MTNSLASEKSPYLLQHADNPVEWLPWGDAAFEKAAREDKPIFLSIGYSTCHWCHVMAHESFESAEIASVLNASFVSIKVDREERPDIDRVYMAYVQVTTGSGGWPMSVWLTPDLKPFYGGTYFPPSARWGRPGFIELLREIARLWEADRPRLLASASAAVERLHSMKGGGGAGEIPGPDALAMTVRQFRHTFDVRRGGFGDAPKFPRPSELLFLFREHRRTGEAEPRDMALGTLRAMALGGMRDHIGGGFHRYSVDGAWRVPHFEKMLYDQAQLVLAYVEALQITHDDFYREVVDDTLAYVRRDLTDPSGGFYSAEDADSVPPEAADDRHAHGTEGAFYLWQADEIDRLLGDEADVFKRRFGIEPNGNAPFDPHNEFTGKNLLYAAQDVEEVGRWTRRSAQEVEQSLRRSRQTLFGARAGRPRPHLDDKVLTAWNGLMIAAFARAGRALASPGHTAAAERAASFFLERMWDPSTRTLRRRYRGGVAGIEAYAEDYACLVAGLVELFQADGDPRWLEAAERLQARQDELFWDAQGGGWFSTTGADPSVLVRLKEEYDGAEPAASSVSVLNLLALAHLTGRTAQFERIERTLRAFSQQLAQLGRAVPLMSSALSAYRAGIRQVVIVGPADAASTRNMRDAVAGVYQPFMVQVVVQPGEHQQRVAALLPFVGSMAMQDGEATAYVCRDFTCDRPVTDPKELAARMSG
jgi:uncharacterized protein YyaL (SSP411 family)